MVVCLFFEMNSKTSLIFAGQGAQFVGMGRDLAETFPECRGLFAQANEALGYDLAKLCFEGPETELLKSQHCQPAVFVVSLVCQRALSLRVPSLAVECAAGLSLGEWSALCLAQAVSFEDGLRILAARGRFMQESCEERAGAMLSVIGLAGNVLSKIAAAAGVEIANFNSPEQTVLSGPKDGIQQAEKMAVAAGAKRAILLNVAGAYHSSLMSGAARKLEQFLRSVVIRPPAMPVVSNVTGLPHGMPEEIKREMVRQVTSSVQWVTSVQWLRQQGVQRYVECGPGRVLCGLVKRIHSGAALLNIQDCPSLDKAAAGLQQP